MGPSTVTGPLPCPLCRCNARSTATHAIAAALAINDIDRALDAGLLDDAGCTSCSSACANARAMVREARIAAFSARERYHQRTARLERRTADRAARRATTPAAPGPSGSNSTTIAGLPPAAAAALARVKARVAGQEKQ